MLDGRDSDTSVSAHEGTLRDTPDVQPRHRARLAIDDGGLRATRRGTHRPRRVGADHPGEKLTRIPIAIHYGDNFPVEPPTARGQDNWRVRLAMARLWVDIVNRHGGDAQLVHLPDVGIRSNTHVLMSDLNNVQIADLVSQFLAGKKLS